MRAKMLLPLALFFVVPAADAQSLPEPQVHLGASFIIAEPQQEFSEYVNTSFGGSLNGLWTPKSHSPLGLRVEGGVIGYGRETEHIPFSSRANRVDVKQTTTNMIAFVSAGPQFSWTHGLVRPYIAPTVGFTYIGTMTSLHGDHQERFASKTHQKDANFALGATGGVYVPVLRGKVPVALDLSTRYTHNGRASYLIEGSIQDNPDGSITFDPIRSNANLLTFHLGISVGIVDDKEKDGDNEGD